MTTTPTPPNPTPQIPQRGEVWLINFDPIVGAEIGKIRPAVVVSDDRIGRLPLRLVVPITEWKTFYQHYTWFVFLAADGANGLTKDSGADAFQTKSVSLRRFRQCLGRVTDSQCAEIALAIKTCVGSP